MQECPSSTTRSPTASAESASPMATSSAPHPRAQRTRRPSRRRPASLRRTCLRSCGAGGSSVDASEAIASSGSAGAGQLSLTPHEYHHPPTFPSRGDESIVNHALVMLIACHGESSGQGRAPRPVSEDSTPREASGADDSRPGSRSGSPRDRANRVPRASRPPRAGRSRPPRGEVGGRSACGARSGERTVNVVIDASAAVEFLLRTAVGVRIDGIVADANLFAPELLDAEVTAVLRRHVLRGELDETRAAEALDDLVSWDIERIPHRDLVLDAWTFRKSVSAYDAFYLAAARRRTASVLTSDGPLARLPVPTGIVVHDVLRR